MQKINGALDFQSYFIDKEVDKKIKSNKDDVLHIVQADIKVLNAKVDSNFEVLNAKIDNIDVKLSTKIDSLASVMQADNKRLGDKIDNLAMSVKWLSTLVKWLVGIFVTIILAAVALLGTDIASLFGR